MASSPPAAKPRVDYTLYLVTDSTAAILGDRDICDVVDQALRGGVTLVQYRDKTSDTGVLVATAKRLHAVTRRHKVPLLINDRADVALAVGCEGVHLGQDDMKIEDARHILGHDKIIGITANTLEEAVTASEQGADYLGVGTLFSTQTKTNTKSVLGPAGLRSILAQLGRKGHTGVPVVCIGGLNASNISQVVRGAGHCAENPVAGVAVVSAIVAAQDAEAAARHLRRLVQGSSAQDAQDPAPRGHEVGTREALLALVPRVIKLVHERKPLSHNMTNLVVQNLAANVALCVGASPIMANYGEEAADLARLGGALVINMGTVTPEGIENYQKALRAYNAAERPVLFDPVGAGATAVRRAAVQTLLATGYMDVIKGNESEIKTVYSSSGGGSTTTTTNSDDDEQNHQHHQQQQRGVDSSSTLSHEAKVALVRSLARRQRAIVVMTGKTDYVAECSNSSSSSSDDDDDDVMVVAIDNGHAYLGAVTGTGCTLGTAISAMMAVWSGTGDEGRGRGRRRLAAVVAGMLLFEIAAERAAAAAGKGAAVEGPGSFVPALLDALYELRTRTARGDVEWLAAAKITVVP